MAAVLSCATAWAQVPSQGPDAPSGFSVRQEPNFTGSRAKGSSGSKPQNSAGSKAQDSGGSKPQDSSGSKTENSAGSKVQDSSGSQAEGSVGSKPQDSPLPTAQVPPVPKAVQPFQLRLERRGGGEDPSAQLPTLEPGTAPPMQNLRIRRDQLNANINKEPPIAPSRFQAASGARIDPGSFGLRAEDWKIPAGAGQTPLRGAAFVQALANYEVELIVDQSLSMQRRDCPGGLSRWEWCGVQLQDLSSQLSPFTPRGFTFTTFAGHFESYMNARPAHVQQLFANPNFNPGTRLSQPLNARLNNYFTNRNARSKPLLIVVITDGVPVPHREPGLVAQALVEASQKVRNANEVTVVFFQIGGTDRYGRFFLSQMDHSLISIGARYDIVRTVSFEQLQQYGLTYALVSCVRNFAQQSTINR